MDSLFYLEQKDGMPMCKGYQICKGDKLTVSDNTKKSCNQLAEELRRFGYSCRVGYNSEANLWSVAIL